jgi:hypothetical protein
MQSDTSLPDAPSPDEPPYDAASDPILHVAAAIAIIPAQSRRIDRGHSDGRDRFIKLPRRYQYI